MMAHGRNRGSDTPFGPERLRARAIARDPTPTRTFIRARGRAAIKTPTAWPHPANSRKLTAPLATREPSGQGPRTMARVHAAVDDATRLADVEVPGDEVPGDERKDTTTGFLLRAPLVPRPRHPGRTGEDRQWRRRPPSPLCQGAAVARHPPLLHPALHAQAQRQGRAVHPDPAARLGLRPLASRIERKKRRPAAMA